MEEVQNQVRICELLAPQIIGNSFIKRVLELQMFTSPNQREKFHILIVGDPGAGKTALANEVHQIMPISTYCSTRTTEIGLSDALIGADGGMVVTDEIDKINKKVFLPLLDVMERQEVSIIKHGYIMNIPTRVNILSLANPTSYNFRLMRGMPLLNQLKIPMPILSRFHLVIPMYELSYDKFEDAAVSHKMDISELKEKRIRYLRNKIVDLKKSNPAVEIPEAICREYGKYIGNLKEFSRLKDMITLRGNEGFSACLKAKARMEGRNKVNMEDFKYVKNIYDIAFGEAND